MLSLVLNNSEFCKIASEFFKTEKGHFNEQDVLFLRNKEDYNFVVLIYDKIIDS